MKGWWALVVAVIAGSTLGYTLRGLEKDPHRSAPFVENRGSLAGGGELGPGREGPKRASLPSLAGLPDDAGWVAEVAMATVGATPEEMAEIWAELVKEKPQKGQPSGQYWLMVDHVMMRWIELAPRQAVAVVRGTGYEFRAWECWARLDFMAALRQAEGLDSRHIETILMVAAETDPDLVVHLLEKYPAHRENVRRTVHRELAKQSPRVALEFDYSYDILRRWMEKEPSEAFDWALENSGRFVESTWQELVPALIEADPEHLDETIGKLPPGPIRQTLLAGKTRDLAQRDVESALALAEGAASVYERKLLIGVVGAEIAEADPERSMQFFEETMKDMGRFGGVSLGSNWVERMVAHDPERAMNVAVGSGMDYAVMSAIRAWASRDSEGYGNWLRTRPNPAERDEHLEYVATLTKNARRFGDERQRFAKALGWVAEMSTEEIRAQQRTALIHEWVGSDHEGAAAYFATEQPSAGERAVYGSIMEEEKP